MIIPLRKIWKNMMLVAYSRGGEDIKSIICLTTQPKLCKPGGAGDT